MLGEAITGMPEPPAIGSYSATTSAATDARPMVIDTYVKRAATGALRAARRFCKQAEVQKAVSSATAAEGHTITARYLADSMALIDEPTANAITAIEAAIASVIIQRHRISFRLSDDERVLIYVWRTREFGTSKSNTRVGT